MTLQAYQNVQRVVEDPRTTEYRLFGQVTGALLNAKNGNVQGAPLIEAIDWNKRMWRTLAVGDFVPKDTRIGDERIRAAKAVEIRSAESHFLYLKQKIARLRARLSGVRDACVTGSNE